MGSKGILKKPFNNNAKEKVFYFFFVLQIIKNTFLQIVQNLLKITIRKL